MALPPVGPNGPSETRAEMIRRITRPGHPAAGPSGTGANRRTAGAAD